MHRTQVAEEMGGPPSPAHEGMQLYSTPVHEGLQPVEGNPYAYGPGGNPAIEPDSAPLSALSAQSAQAGGREVKYDSAPAPPYPGRRICGVATRVFWTIFGVVVLLVVIAAAVGGGVGGSQAARHAKEVSNARLVLSDIIFLTYFNCHFGVDVGGSLALFQLNHHLLQHKFPHRPNLPHPQH